MPKYVGKKLVKEIKMRPKSKVTSIFKYYNKGEKIPIYDYEVFSYKKQLVKCHFVDLNYRPKLAKAIEVDNTSDITAHVEVYEILTADD